MPCILVVDDDVDTREALRAVLLDEGFEVRVAGDGQAAIGQLTGPEKLALILLDSLMPEMDGAQVLDFIAGHRDLDGIAVVIMSADPHPRQHQRAGAVLRKPFTLEELMRVSRALMGGPVGDRPAAPSLSRLDGLPSAT